MAAEYLYVHRSCYDEKYKDQLEDALNVFKWQITDEMVFRSRMMSSPLTTYTIITYDDWWQITNGLYVSEPVRSNKVYLLFKDHDEFYAAMDEIHPENGFKYTWERFNKDKGYEVTSRGDKRYSPFFMKIPDRGDRSKYITLEDHYHLHLKGYELDGYTSWNQCKSLPPKPSHAGMLEERTRIMYECYLSKYMGLMYNLALEGQSHVFTDMFGTTNNSQARYYCDILNKYYMLE